MSDPLGKLFDQFVQERIYLHNVTPKTQVWYRTAWKAFKASQTSVGDAPLTKTQLQAFVVHMRQRDVSARSVNTYLQALNAFARWLHQEGHQEQLVRLRQLKTEKRVIDILTQPRIRQMVQFRPKTFTQWRTFTLVCLLLDTGMRIDEALGLEIQDVDLGNLLATVFGKGRKERRIPFSFECRKTLYRFIQQRERSEIPGQLFFGSRKGTKWGQRNALRSYYLIQKRLGIPKSGFHRLRHTFATEYLRAGGDVVRLSRILGHAHVSTTLAYEHLGVEDLQAVHQRLSILNRIR